MSRSSKSENLSPPNQKLPDAAENLPIESHSAFTGDIDIRLHLQMLDAIRQAVIATDLQGLVIYWNKFAEELYGWVSEEVIGRRIMDLTTPEPESLQAELIMAQLREGRSWSGEFRVRRKDGSTFPAQVTNSPIYNDHGVLIGIVGISNDITRRRQAEKAISESQEILRLAMSSSRMGAWSRDLITDETYWSAELEAIYGQPREAFSQGIKGSYTYVHEDDREAVERQIDRALAEHREYVMEFRFSHADGSIRWMEGRGKAVYDSSELPVKMYGIGIDITTRKRAQLSAEFLANVRKDLIGVASPDEFIRLVGEQLHSYLNISICALVEVSETQETAVINYEWHQPQGTDLTGTYHLPDFVTDEFRQTAKRGQSLVIRDVAIDERIADKAGFAALKIGAFINVPLIRNNKWEFTLGIYHEEAYPWRPDEIDLMKELAASLLRRLERLFIEQERERFLQIEQTARAQAENANRLKDEFLATVSHELRTPLNAILGWSQMLQTGRFNDEAIKNGLLTIERNARSQNNLIEDLLDVSRIITGKLRLNVQGVDLAAIINAAIDAMRPSAEAKEIRLQILLDPAAEIISGDPDRLQQVVWNLLSNAVKFTPKGGRVEVRLERIDSHIEISVADTGQGIPTEFLPFIFERFSQGDQTTTRKFGGLGLGLALVRQLVEMHGGHVSAESAGEGQGTTFRIFLPLLPVRVEPAGDEHPVPSIAERRVLSVEQSELSGLQILVVDDEPDARDLMEVVLSAAGAHITMAASATEALELMRQGTYDLLVTDIGMPNEDGYSLIQKVRTLPPETGGKIPAIALTGYARAEDRFRALRSGFQMHISKPVDSAELVAVAANLTGRIKSGRS